MKGEGREDRDQRSEIRGQRSEVSVGANPLWLPKERGRATRQ